MNTLLIFQNPAIAQKLREAGFFVFVQQYDGKRCFAAEKSDALLEQLHALQETFGEISFAKAHTLHF